MNMERTNKILVVDDEELIREALSRMLRRYGQVTELPSGEEALAALQNGNYDLCFLDLKLPGISGLDVLNIVADRSLHTRFVVMTAYSTEALVPLINEFACHFIQKPFELDEVRSIAAGILSPETDTASRGGHREGRRRVSQTVACMFSVRALEYPKTIELEVSITNLSSGGLSFLTDYPMESGDGVTFSEATGLGSAIVRWRRPSDEPGLYSVGAAFRLRGKRPF